ncbi:PadR family transcriptional regulator [Paenibacillus sp. YPG26]|uniref:PadR family transcriptional regulator n=1 Tax=Paenibacillus sp. YPG26 TaxID=2878915 RepID=UPI0020419567|nr:PadR family transcriptional regulator [Paenibacillus sp. YPG26]USB34647.1 PadR family transcriptional regulator [Paenibacillus sp. YPG26]
MNDKSQMLKGTLEGCILKIISTHETYGYEISEKLISKGFPNISEGTIYPLLMRLEKNGLIAANYKNSPLGPKRKYFNLTNEGLIELEAFWEKWLTLVAAVHKLFD